MESVLLYIVGVLVVVVGVLVSIGLHEVGHLVPAKKFGVKVSQYMIGFGPTLWSKRRGETEYGLKAIPLGGYISMAGMFPPAKDGGRARTATTGFFDTVVQEGAREDKREAGRAELGVVTEARQVSADTLGGDDSRAFYKLAVWKRMIIMLGGPFMNLLIAVVLYAVLLVGFGVPQLSTTLGSVNECVIPAASERQECEPGDPRAPGLVAGLQPGDRLISFNGEAIESWQQATALIQQSPDTDMTIVFERDGAEQTVTARPMLSERYVIDQNSQIVENDAGEPVTQAVGFLGIGPAQETVRQPITAVLPAVGDNIVRVGEMILNLPQRLIDIAQAAFGTEERDPNGPMSVVGVGRLAGEITSLNSIPVMDRIGNLAGLLASLNVALFVFNLIPLMPLDGGHVAGAAFEGIRRFFAKLFGRPDPGPVDTAKLIPLTLTIALVLGAMSLLLIYADFVKPISIL